MHAQVLPPTYGANEYERNFQILFRYKICDLGLLTSKIFTGNLETETEIHWPMLFRIGILLCTI